VKDENGICNCNGMGIINLCLIRAMLRVGIVTYTGVGNRYGRTKCGYQWFRMARLEGFRTNIGEQEISVIIS
jgi:hypothetical protein